MPKIIDYEKLTSDQKIAVDQDGEVLVSAAAGSGKTTALLAKIKRLIECGIPLSKMLILVYNESAAAEIKQKLSTELFNCACEYSGDKAELYRKQLDEIAFAHVGTIHSFCRAAIRENFEKLSLSPSFDVLDENAHDLYMKRALDDVFTDYTAAKDELFFKLCSVFESNRNEEEIKEIVKKIFEQFDVQPDKQAYADKVLSSYADANDNPYKKIVINALRNKIDKIKCNLFTVKHDIYMSDEQGYMNLADDLCNFVTACENPDDDAFLKALTDDHQFSSPRAKGNSPYKDIIEIIKALKKAVVEIKEQATDLFGDKNRLEKEFAQNKLFAEKLIEVTMKFSSRLDQLKKADGVLSFADLEHGVVNLIGQGVDISEDYDYVFVDEYQDVNRTQETIIKHLLKENSFFVGDIKQSIYGFRLANPDIFLERLKKREEGAKNGDGIAPIKFVDNFRSENQILEFVNEIFDKVMTVESADVDYHNDARFNKAETRNDGSVKMALIFAPSKKKEDIDSGIYKIVEEEQEDQEDGKNEYEGKYIAREIKSLVGKGTFGDRKLTYGDFAILFRKRTDSNAKILATLKSEGIPVDDGSFVKDDDASEKELVTFLKVIDNPRQDFAFTGFLLSYFGGYNENELFEISKCNKTFSSKDKKGNFYDAFMQKAQDDDALGSKCARTLDKLNEYRIKASFKSVASLVSTIIAENDYDAYLRSKGDAILNSVESFVASISTDENNIGLTQFLSEYDTNKKSDKKSVGGDRVQVSTFHAYKGLEVPVVFIANAAGERDTRSGKKDWFILDNGILGLSYFDGESKMKNRNTLSMMALKYAIKTKEYKEEMRLAYVALTRAQKMLYITGKSSCTVEKPSKEDYFSSYYGLKLDEGKSIYDFIFAAKMRGANIADPEVYLPKDFVETEKNSPVIPQTDSATMRMIEGSLEYSYPYKESTTLPIKYSVSALVNVGEDEPQTVRVFENITNVGTIYHKFMENIDFDICDLDDVENRKKQLVDDGIMTREDADVIDDMNIIKVLQTPELKMASTHEHECEKPFMMYVPANEVNPDTTATDKVLVQGVIDLWIKGDKEKGEGDVIVDYKYSALKDERSLKNYEKQLKLYKMAIEKAFSVKIDEICLISLKTGEVRKFD